MEWDTEASFTENLEFVECAAGQEPCSCPIAIAFAKSECIPIRVRPAQPDPPEWQCLDEHDTAPECDNQNSSGGRGDQIFPNPFP